jgi:hypothetical protein
MEHKFWADLDAFWTSVFEVALEMQPDWTLQPDGVLTYQNAPNWFQFRRKGEAGTRPYLKIVGTWYSATIINDGVIRLECAWDKSTPQQRATMARSGSALPNCSKDKGTASSLFIASIDCKDGASTRDIASALVELFRSIHQLVDQTVEAVDPQEAQPVKGA